MNIIIDFQFEGELFDIEAENLSKRNIGFSKSKSFFGGDEVIQIITIVTPVVIGAVTKIVLEKIKTAKNSSLKINGIEVENLSEENTVQIFNKIVSILEKNKSVEELTEIIIGNQNDKSEKQI
jgi:uncharacterized protein YejL (UPF0352 family)